MKNLMVTILVFYLVILIESCQRESTETGVARRLASRAGESCATGAARATMLTSTDGASS